MNKSWLFFLFLLFGFAPEKMVKTKISNGISFLLPSEFYPMTPDDVAQRFPSVRAPLGSYTNQERVVDFNVNISATQWPDEDLRIAQKFFKAGLLNLYDKVDVIEEGVHEINKRKYIFFEFESYVRGNKRQPGNDDSILKYTYIQYLVQPKRTLVFAFSCPKAQRQDWQKTVAEIMTSVKVK